MASNARAVTYFMELERITRRQTAFIAVLGLITSPSLACAAPSDPTALSNIVNRYIAWRGGGAFERLQSVHIRGSLKTAGLEGTEDLWADRAGRERVDSDLGVLKQIQVVAPGQSWDTAPSGQVETMARSDDQSLSRDAALQFSDTLKGRGGAKAELAAPQIHDGRSWAVVRVTFGDQDTYDVLIASSSGELGGFKIVEDRQGRFESFGDWRMVGGVRMPFLQTIKTEAPGGDQAVQITSTELNQPIPAERLDRPAPIHRASFKEGATSTGWIDFEFYQGDRIFLSAKINGHDAIVLLDSGATVSAIDTTFASALGLAPKGGFTAPGTGGVDTAGFVGGVDVQVGNLTLKHVNAAAIDLKPVAVRIGHRLPFVLGDEVFNELAVDIDFAHHRLAFRDPVGLTAPLGSSTVPLDRIFGNRSVPVAIEGKPPVPFEFDLGNGGELEVYPAYYQAHPLLKERQRSQILSGGVGGFHPTTVISLRQVTFAGIDFHGAPAVLTNDTLSGSNSNIVVGNVGLSILARFRLVIDYSHNRLYAAPYADATNVPFRKDRVGMSLRKVGDQIQVDYVSPNSPAQTAGFKTGDLISRLNEKPAKDWTESAIALLRYGPTSSVMRVTTADGLERKLTLEDFF